ncbi:MAG: acyl-CoA dehydrogenase [Deltaproteobacteria bacterium]|nr:acyl-CoA dehydrogenase [Deltaproteobacteria bacterium]
MGNLLVNGRDQRFVLYEQLGVEKIFQSEKYADYSREVAEMMLGEAEKMAVEDVLPTYDKGDREGCTLKDGVVSVPQCYHQLYKKFCEAGWIAATKSPDIGGQGMPVTLFAACTEPFNAANFAFMMYPGLTWGAAGLIEKYGTEAQKSTYMTRMLTGEWAGTMCLTEPNAGTDVGAIRTTAKRRPDGTFSINGTKMFISSGDHNLTENIIHPVLARIEGDPAGTGGISLFIVPKYRVNDDGSLGEANDVVTGNIEHKMGIRGSATATLNFGENGNCIGELLGEERKGMKIMFLMMNEARLEVGMQGLGHATAAYEHAVQYAKERVQSRPIWEMENPAAEAVPIIQHPDVRRMLLWMKSYVEGIRAMNYFIAYCVDLASIAGTKEEKEKWFGMMELLTPLSKAFSSDMAVEIASLAIDVYGGYGYIQEYPIEQYMRDAKIACLYEGTNGIQALDLVGRKLAQNKGKNAMNLFAMIGETCQAARKCEELKPYAAFLEEAYTSLAGLTMKFKDWSASANMFIPILNARPYLMIMGDVVVGWLLMQAAAISAEKLGSILGADGLSAKPKRRAEARKNSEAAFYEGKLAAAKFFATTVLPAVKGRCRSIEIADKAPLEILEESFSV